MRPRYDVVWVDTRDEALESHLNHHGHRSETDDFEVVSVLFRKMKRSADTATEYPQYQVVWKITPKQYDGLSEAMGGGR